MDILRMDIAYDWLEEKMGKGVLETIQDGADITVAFEGDIARPVKVIVLEVEYSNTYSPVSKTVGSGKAYVFTNGVVYVGSWERTDRLGLYVLRDSAGAPIKLTPGQTFIQVARAEKVAIIGSGIDPETIDYP